MRQLLSESGDLAALLGLLFFVGLFGLMVFYIVTDRRHQHHRRMESLALDEDLPEGDDAHG